MIPHGAEIFVGLDPIDLRWRLSLPTADGAFPPKTSKKFLSPSSARREKERVWGWRSSSRSSRATTASSPSKAGKERGPRSALHCHYESTILWRNYHDPKVPNLNRR